MNNLKYEINPINEEFAKALSDIDKKLSKLDEAHERIIALLDKEIAEAKEQIEVLEKKLTA